MLGAHWNLQAGESRQRPTIGLITFTPFFSNKPAIFPSKLGKTIC
jgi:hypothetical protein